MQRRAAVTLLFLVAALPQLANASGKAGTPSRRAAEGIVAFHQQNPKVSRVEMYAERQPNGGYMVRHEISSKQSVVYHFDAGAKLTKVEAHTWDQAGLSRAKPTVTPLELPSMRSPTRVVAQNLCQAARGRNAQQMRIASHSRGGEVHVQDWVLGEGKWTARSFKLATGERLSTVQRSPRNKERQHWDQGGKQKALPAPAPVALKQTPAPSTPKGFNGTVKPVASPDPLAAAALKISEGGLRLPFGYRIARVQNGTGSRLMIGKVAKLGATQELVSVKGKTYLVSHNPDGSQRQVSGRMGALKVSGGKVTYAYQPIVNGVRQSKFFTREAPATAFPKGFMNQPRVASSRPGTPIRTR